MRASCLVLLSFVLAAPAGAEERPRLRFKPVDVPMGAAQGKTVATAEGTWGGTSFPLTMIPLAYTADVVEGGVWGQSFDIAGAPIRADDGRPVICNSTDGVSILPRGDALFAVVHGECQPGTLTLAELDQDDAGALSVKSARGLDLAPVGGGNLFCAAEATPWGSHLAAEEYEADIRKLQPDGTVSDDHEAYNRLAWYHGDAFPSVSPYDYGWIDEVELLDAAGRTLVTKRTAMGRFSHEQARVMPDGRTVYLSDDGTNGGFFLFVADVAGDLSVGMLYAARWDASDAGVGALSWVSLGRASEAQVATWRARGTGFDDLFESSDPDACAAPFRSIHTMFGRECLRVRPGAELAASRLETRRYAALRGATTEFSKSEGTAIDPVGRTLHMAIARVNRGMLAADPTWDAGGPDHIGLPPRPCGVVLGVDVIEGAVDTDGAAIASEWVVSPVSIVAEGYEASYRPKRLRANACALDRIAGPDNVAFIPEAGVLLIAEDTSAKVNNALWALDVATGDLTRILTVPRGGEVAGLQWYPDVRGRGYITFSVQEPYSDWGDIYWQDTEEGDPRSFFGTIGPFPPLR